MAVVVTTDVCMEITVLPLIVRVTLAVVVYVVAYTLLVPEITLADT